MRHKLTLAVSMLSVACAAARNTTTAPLLPCAPGDQSWGCRSANQAAMPAPNSLTQSGPSFPAGSASAPVAANPQAQGAPNFAPIGVSTPQSTTAAPLAADDPINLADTQYQHTRVTAIVAELISALDSSTRARVDRLPIIFDPNRGDINAFATCTQSGKATIAITDGLLVLATYLAQLQAADEVFGTRHFDEYVTYVAKNQPKNSPVLGPNSNWFPVEVRNNPTKVTRQQQLNDEMIAFVMGHELGHHYLNHLPCTSILPLDAAELGLVLTSEVPAFNQINETAADIAGTRNVLEAGQRRTGYHLTEGGALLTLRFFRALDQASPVDVFNFERTHPPPSLREPVVQTAAQGFRASSAIAWPWKL
jgi:hypothetical protein